jgi:hypothetical protein
MRIGLAIVETLLYLVALFGFVFGIVIVVASRSAEAQELKAASTVAGLYLALPAFTLGAIGLAGGAVIAALVHGRNGR